MGHKDKYHHGWRAGEHANRCEMYDKPTGEDCHHDSTTLLYNVVEDVVMEKCKDCGQRLDKKKPR